MIYEVREIEEGELAEVIPLIKKIFPHACLDIGDEDLFFVATAKDRIVGRSVGLSVPHPCFARMGHPCGYHRRAVARWRCSRQPEIWQTEKTDT